MPGNSTRTSSIKSGHSNDHDATSSSSGSRQASTSKAGSVIEGPSADVGQADTLRHHEGDTHHGEDDELDETSDGSEVDDEDEGEDEDEEPTLRYTRLASEAIAGLFARDTCSAIAVSSRYIVLGTHGGGVYVLGRRSGNSGKGKGKASLHQENGSAKHTRSETPEQSEGMETIKRYKPHSAAVMDIVIDEESQYVATASTDGKVIILQLASSDAQEFNLKRPLRCLALEPSYAAKSTKQFISGGLSGSLILHEKGWLGPKDVTLHSGEGTIWSCAWRRNYIAWSNDRGVRIYDTHSATRIAFVARPDDAPRTDLFPCNLLWQNQDTLVVAWADFIKVVKVRDRREEARKEREREKELEAEKGSIKSDRSKNTSTGSANPLAGMGAYVPGFGSSSIDTSASNQKPVYAEVVSILQLDCMISGIVPFLASPSHDSEARLEAPTHPSETHETTSTFLVMSHLSTDSYDVAVLHGGVVSKDNKRTPSHPPELRIISISSGEELSSDVLPVSEYERWDCKDYKIIGAFPSDVASTNATSNGRVSKHRPSADESYFVISPKDVVMVKKRDIADHIAWLCERKRYEEALKVVEQQYLSKFPLESSHLDVSSIGAKYLQHLIEEQGNYQKAAENATKIFASTADPVKNWEDFVFMYAQKGKLDAVIPYIPTSNPQLSKLVYELVLVHYLNNEPATLLQTLKTWPRNIYDIPAVLNAIKGSLDRDLPAATSDVLMECLIELHLMAHQPGKAISYYLRLRKPGVFDLIRENSLFTDIQDHALLLVDFDMDMRRRARRDSEARKSPQAKAARHLPDGSKHGEAIDLLIDHTHSIPISRVIAQLKSNRYYLYMYLDALFDKEPQSAIEHTDSLVDLYAEFDYERLLDLLRKSTSYSLEKAYAICRERDYVPEMVFLLGRMGSNKQALTLIIERLGDVQRAIDFAKEQNDHDLWEDLLTYSETRPPFIRGLLENVGPEIDPIRLIRRIKDGLEIPGLKSALIKILQDFNIQISLIEGCKTILNTDCRSLTIELYSGQSSAFFGTTGTTTCYKCLKPAFLPPESSSLSTPSSATSPDALSIVFLCRHVFHISCALPDMVDLPPRPQHYLNPLLLGTDGTPAAKDDRERDIAAKILFSAQLKSRARGKVSCPTCLSKTKTV